MSTACMRLPLCCGRFQHAFLPAARSCVAGPLNIVGLVRRTHQAATWRSHHWCAVHSGRRAFAHAGIGAGNEDQPDDTLSHVSESSRLQTKLDTVNVYFSSDGVYTNAQPGDNLWAVASKAGIVIPTSCNSGSCGTCEMEVRKWDEAGVAGGTSIARTCIAAVPPGYPRLQLDAMDDGIWGADGFDM